MRIIKNKLLLSIFLASFSFSNNAVAELSDPKKFITEKFSNPGTYEWTVPPNVYKVRILGASGANGGAGGGGSGVSHSSYRGSWSDFTQGGNGGNSGKANGEAINIGEKGKPCRADLVYMRESSGTNGENAELGTVTRFKNVTFSQAAEYIKDNYFPSILRKGGKGGAGGESQKGICGSNVADFLSGGAGGNGINGWNSLFEIHEADVIPGEKIPVVIGKGGKGGAGGIGGNALYRASNHFYFANDGKNGTDGTDGEHGFLEITYEIYQ